MISLGHYSFYTGPDTHPTTAFLLCELIKDKGSVLVLHLVVNIGTVEILCLKIILGIQKKIHPKDTFF